MELFLTEALFKRQKLLTCFYSTLYILTSLLIILFYYLKWKQKYFDSMKFADSITYNRKSSKILGFS